MTFLPQAWRRCMLRWMLCATVLVPLLAPAAARAAAPAGREVVLLGNASYPPFTYRDGDSATGLVAALARAVLDRGEIRGRYEVREWKQAQADVREGRADGLVLINRTPEREAFLEFSRPLITSNFVLFRQSGRMDVTGPESLQQRTVAVEKGGYTPVLMSRFAGIRQREVADLQEAFDLLGRGEVDAVVTERWAGMYELSRREVAGIAVIEKPLETSLSYIAVRKGNTALLERINRGLDQIERDGTRDLILQQWSGKQVLFVTRDTISHYRLTQWLAAAVIILLTIVFLISRKLARIRREAVELENAELERRVANRTRELITARAEAERATASRTQFMANVSDQMRNPLQGVLGYATIGRQRLTTLGEHDLAECFDRIAESGERMSRLVESMLTIAEKSWKERLVYSDQYEEGVRLDTLMAECIENLSMAAQHHGQQLAMDSAATATTIDGDTVRLRQVLHHLVENAIRFAPPGSTIRLRTSDAFLPAFGDAPVKAVNLEIIDDGPGIPPEDIEDIFKPFHRGTRPVAAANGAGLGLPLCRTIVEQHGGHLRAINRPDGGTVFEVRLPCSALPAAPDAGERPAGAALLDSVPARRAYLECTHGLLEYVGPGGAGQRLAEHQDCPFGQWLAGPGEPFSLFQEYHDLAALHVRLHEIAAQAAVARQEGRAADAQRIMDEAFADVSRQAIPLLDTLKID